MSNRMFIAIDIEKPPHRKRLKEIQQECLQFGDMNPTKPENFHITLNFIGNVNDEKTREIKRQLKTAIKEYEGSPFQVSVGGLGSFPKKSYIKVLWAGLVKNHKKIHRLHDTITDQLDDMHIDEHSFTPHITLSRLNHITREDKQQLHDVMNKYQNTVLFEMTIDKILLKNSSITDDGPVHKIVEKYDL
ncbi:MAG: RNA 2',3'-cyclic phosphodiesterase [Candidatus Nanohaloarchaeota archaeon QJJ-5]|nr:RNA 2',3'-cyclic phosphodiesterase [Candidatus Nanohaloarchaeota archaeon QJJ-5]